MNTQKTHNRIIKLAKFCWK